MGPYRQLLLKCRMQRWVDVTVVMGSCRPSVEIPACSLLESPSEDWWRASGAKPQLEEVVCMWARAGGQAWRLTRAAGAAALAIR
jgi:hypothetical protein